MVEPAQQNLSEASDLSKRGYRMSPVGYEPTWAGTVEAQSGPLDLHALITPGIKQRFIFVNVITG